MRTNYNIKLKHADVPLNILVAYTYFINFES